MCCTTYVNIKFWTPKEALQGGGTDSGKGQSRNRNVPTQQIHAKHFQISFCLLVWEETVSGGNKDTWPAVSVQCCIYTQVSASRACSQEVLASELSPSPLIYNLAERSGLLSVGLWHVGVSSGLSPGRENGARCWRLIPCCCGLHREESRFKERKRRKPV